MSWMYSARSMDRLSRFVWIGVVAGAGTGALLGVVVGVLAGDVDVLVAAAVVLAALGGYPGMLAREGIIMLRIVHEEGATEHRIEALTPVVMAGGIAVGAVGGVVAGAPLGSLLLPVLACAGGLVGGFLATLTLTLVVGFGRMLPGWAAQVAVPLGAATALGFLGALVAWGVTGGAMVPTSLLGAVGAAAGLWVGNRLVVPPVD